MSNKRNKNTRAKAVKGRSGGVSVKCQLCTKQVKSINNFSAYFSNEGEITPYALCRKCMAKMQKGDEAQQQHLARQIEFNLEAKSMKPVGGMN